jgi:WD40 repeat protein
METIFTKRSIEANQNVFLLKNYKQHSKFKFTVLDFIKKSILSVRFQKFGNVITAIAAHNNTLIIGNNIGIIKTYSCDQQLEFNTLTIKDAENFEKKGVNCMDISSDGELLLVGYANGYIALWELATLKVRKLIKDIHKSSVVACKFIRNDSKKSDFVTSDLEGSVFKSTVKSGYFSYSVDTKVLIRNNTPIFLINVLKLEDEEKKNFSSEIQKSIIIAFGCLEFTMIYMLEPEFKKLLRFEKPKYVKDNSVPDISMGIGFVPNIQETQLVNDSIMDATGNQSFWQGQKNIDPTKPQILLSISWGRIIYLYCLPCANNSIYGFTTAGHYINPHPIIRMSFLSNSIIFFFDKMKLCRVINSSLITPGEVRLSAENEQPISILDSLRKPELQEGYLVDPDLKYQTYIIDKADNKARATYNNHIISFNKNIFVLSNKDFYHGKLLNWEQCLNNLNSNSEWHSALTLGLDIYNGRETALADIPQDEQKRKKRVGNALRTLIHQYTIMHMNNDNKIFTKDQDPKQWLSNCINTCIEFCIEIESLDFLLTHLQPIFHGEGYEDDFIQRLEPFIVSDKIKNQQLQQLTIHKIIDFYVKNSKLHALSQILIHLDIHSIDVDYIKDICNKYNLITPLIYVYTNNEEEDYFYPIKKIFEIFEKAKEIKNFTTYQEVLKILPLEELENSKQYIGHKLLWFINLCINGKKIHNTNIHENKYRKLIIKILAWILKDEIFSKFLVFDSHSLFSILIKYFEDEKLRTIISEETSENFSGINNKLMDMQPITILDVIVSRTKEIESPNKSTILKDLYEFIGRVSIFISTICKSLIIESIIYLLSNTSNENNLNVVNNYSKYLENINNTIIEMIDSRSDFDKKDYYTVLKASEVSPYVLVKIHLLKLNKNYKNCLEVFVQSDIKLQDKEKKVFEWIDLTLRELNDVDYENFDSLKEEVLNKLPLLADISIEKVTHLVEFWFEDEQDIIIEKLDKAENLQLKYVENVIEKIKDDVDYSGENDRKYEQYVKILNLHIKLLCKINPTQVLPNLKKRNYPPDECLKKCLEYKIIDASIHLMQNIGAFKDALLLALNTLKENFDTLIENINSSNFNENLHNEKMEELKLNIKQAISICENNNSKNDLSDDNQDMWFMILEELYNFIETTKNYFNNRFKTYAEDLNKKLSTELKDVLEKMCSYVSIEAIITNVTEKYKQAEFKEFKKLLLNMLSSYSHLKNILISAKNLLSNSVLYNVIELKKLNQKGNRFNFNKCDQCSKGFNPISEDPIIVFGCGHKCHFKCACYDDNGEAYCITCRKNEIENSLFTIGRKSLIQRV